MGNVESPDDFNWSRWDANIRAVTLATGLRLDKADYVTFRQCPHTLEHFDLTDGLYAQERVLGICFTPAGDLRVRALLRPQEALGGRQPELDQELRGLRSFVWLGPETFPGKKENSR
jgi:hypothetical protein